MAVTDFEDIVNDFNFLDDWEDRYKYIIDLGKKLTPLEDSLKNEDTKVEGCASQVWLVHNFIDDGSTKNIVFKGDSDALIVKGLVAIVLTLFNGEKIDVVKDIDAFAQLEKLGLRGHLSAQRSNGLRAMVEKINWTIRRH